VVDVDPVVALPDVSAVVEVDGVVDEVSVDVLADLAGLRRGRADTRCKSAPCAPDASSRTDRKRHFFIKTHLGEGMVGYREGTLIDIQLWGIGSSGDVLGRISTISAPGLAQEPKLISSENYFF
jgi:hypothetical protein